MLQVALLVIGGFVLTVVVYFLIPLRRPWPTEADYSHHTTPWWQLYYLHKYLWPRTKPENGAGLDEYFRTRSFDFDATTRDGARELTIGAVGDLMARRDLLGDGGVHLWDEIGESFFSADLTIGNLEFAINEEVIIEKTVQYSVPATFAEPLLGDKRYGTFDYVSLGNNHINDSLSGGIRRTCEYLDSIGIAHSGANRNKEEQDNIPILDVKGVKIALLAYTFSTNGVPLDAESTPFGVNVVRFNALDDGDYDDSLIRHHIDLARSKGADYIISSHHWGCDHEVYPPKRVVERAHDLFELGVDMIIGHHPHIVGPVDDYEASDGRRCLAYYSLGSLTTYALAFAHQRLSLIAETVLQAWDDDDGRTVVRPKKVILTPAYHSMNSVSGRVSHQVLPVADGVEKIRSGDVPASYSARDRRHLTHLYRFYDRLLRVDGIDYR